MRLQCKRDSVNQGDRLPISLQEGWYKKSHSSGYYRVNCSGSDRAIRLGGGPHGHLPGARAEKHMHIGVYPLVHHPCWWMRVDLLHLQCTCTSLAKVGPSLTGAEGHSTAPQKLCQLPNSHTAPVSPTRNS